MDNMPIQNNGIKLSILICTIPGREDKLHRLEEILRPQQTDEVEVIIATELANVNGGPTIGANRNALLESAAGDYVCFIDDDDIVSEKYVELVLKAIDDFYENQAINVLNGAEGSLVSAIKQGGPDVIGIKGHYTVGDGKPQLFIHSMQYDKWFTENGVHYRSPNHLNPVKRELALQARFTDKNNGEDYDYSMALRPLLKTEKMIGEVIYHYKK